MKEERYHLMASKQEISGILVELISEGKSNEAWSLLFKEYGKPVISYLLFHRWSKEEAIEILHDSFFILEKKILEGQATKVNKAFIKKICKLLGANIWRKKVRNTIAFNKYMSEATFEMNNSFRNDFKMDLFDQEENEPLNRLVLRAFELLKQNCQEIIKLKHVENLNHLEISEKMKNISSEDSSKTILNRCMNNWKSIISKLNKQNGEFKLHLNF